MRCLSKPSGRVPEDLILRETAAVEETLGMCRLTYSFLDMNEALTSAQSCTTIRVRQNRNALGAEFDWGQLAEAHERWGDRDCRSMQRVRHRGVAGVLFVNESFSQFNRTKPCEGLGGTLRTRKPFLTRGFHLQELCATFARLAREQAYAKPGP